MVLCRGVPGDTVQSKLMGSPAGCGADDGERWSEVVEVDVWLLLLLVLEAAVRALVT